MGGLKLNAVFWLFLLLREKQKKRQASFASSFQQAGFLDDILLFALVWRSHAACGMRLQGFQTVSCRREASPVEQSSSPDKDSHHGFWEGAVAVRTQTSLLPLEGSGCEVQLTEHLQKHKTLRQATP